MVEAVKCIACGESHPKPYLGVGTGSRNNCRKFARRKALLVYVKKAQLAAHEKVTCNCGKTMSRSGYAKHIRAGHCPAGKEGTFI